MKKSLKKALSSVMAFAMVSSMSVIPASAEQIQMNGGSGAAGGASDVINTWMFDFGTAENADEGSYAVTKETHYNTNIVDGLQFGLLGTNEDDYKLASYVDGVDQQKGQVTVLADSADGEAIGAATQEVSNHKVAGDYPVRFAMKATNNSYYRVTAQLTTLDDSKEAQANLFSERRHAIITEETIPAGDTKTVIFTATPQNVAVKNRAAGTTDIYRDDMLNVVAVGDNLAIANIMIEEVAPKTAIWMYDDSTGCDYAMLLPFFPYQNYGGTGQFMSKYLAENIAIVNQGDGGINAADNIHWNCANANIKEGDYIYVQYGHNHKDDGLLGYLKSLSKYYNHAVDKGANLILAGPIDRHNDGQYNSTENKWSSTLGGFSKVAKHYAELIIVGGKSRADEFVEKAQAAGELTDEVYAWADEVIAKGITDEGATNIAFVDLNQPTLTWLEQVCADIKEIRGVDYYEKNATDYYFRVTKGGGVDGTHPNDGGADNTASFFFNEAAKIKAQAADNEILAVEAAVLENLVADKREATPYKISNEIVLAGGAGGAGWPEVYVPDNLPELPAEIKKIEFNTDGSVAKASVEKRSAKLDMGAYGIIVITIYNPDGSEKGKLYAVDQVDNTVNGVQEIVNFRGDATLGEDDTYSAIVLKAVDTDSGLKVDEDDPTEYSSKFVPTDIETVLITDEDGNDTEDFDYYGAIYTGDEVSNISSYNSWIVGGSSGKTTTLGIDGDRHYANFIAKNGNSAYVMKKFNSSVGTTGRYMLEADLQYVSGSGMKVTFAGGIKASSPFASDEILLYTVESNGSIKVNGLEAGALNTNSWATVRAILDMDAGTLSVSVAGGTPVVTDISNYSKFTSDITPSSLAGVSFNGSKTDVGIRISNLTAAKLYDDKAKTTISVAAAEGKEKFGTVSVGDNGLSTMSVLNGSTVTAKASANDGYIFKGWFENGVLFSEEEELSLRLYRDLSLTAEFAVATAPAVVKVNYLNDKGDVMKSEDITMIDGEIIRTGDEFVLPNEKTGSIKLAKGDIFEVYAYDSSKSDSLTITSLEEKNVINLVFAKQDGYYYIYEDFTDVKDDWGFVEGSSNNVNILSDGTLQLFAQSGTSASKQGSDVKTLDTNIQGLKKVTIGFDWNVTADKNRSSLFNLVDTNDNVIFSLYGGGTDGSYYMVGANAGKSNTKIASSSKQWVRVSLNLDFEAMKVSGTVKNLSTGTEYTVAETTITATNLAQMKTVYGYSAAPQTLDNVWIKVDENSAWDTPAGMTYADGVISITTETDYDSALLYIASYNADGSLAAVTVESVALTAGKTSNVSIEATSGDKIMLWNGMQNIFSALTIAE